MARSVWRFSRSQSSIVIRSRSLRRPCSRRMAQSARAMAILSAGPRNVKSRKLPVKCSGAGSPPACKHRSPAARLHKEELLVKLDPVRHAQAAVEIHQIDAAAQQHVLAVVDHFRRCRPEPDKKWRGRPGIPVPQKDRLGIPIGPARQPRRGRPDLRRSRSPMACRTNGEEDALGAQP